MVAFAGWEMPVQYDGPIAEHLAVRATAGAFDVSHMGQIEMSGPGALELLGALSSNDVGGSRSGAPSTRCCCARTAACSTT